MTGVVLWTVIGVGGALLLAAIAALVWGLIEWRRPIVDDGAHTRDDIAPGHHGPLRKSQVAL